jgi:WXXGXW repeat (2 copies)
MRPLLVKHFFQENLPRKILLPISCPGSRLAHKRLTFRTAQASAAAFSSPDFTLGLLPPFTYLTDSLGLQRPPDTARLAPSRKWTEVRFALSFQTRAIPGANPRKRKSKMIKMSLSRTISLAALIGASSLGILSTAPATSAQLSIGVAVTVPPPALPVYAQPPCPGPDYLWTPGYWAWDGTDYYWVPGTWVEAPDPGLLWTPGYWGWGDGGYFWHTGYWGPVIGFYGGINYGFGYYGHGYDGGRWNGGHFYYNSAVNNVNVTVVHNTYVDKTVVVNNVHEDRVSFNGGNGGVQARATAQEDAAAHQQRMGAIAAQNQQAQVARSDRQLHASYNHGAPPVAATARPGNFSGSGVVRANNAPAANQPAPRAENNARPENNVHHAPTTRPANNAARPNQEVRPNTPSAAQHNPAPNTNQQRMERQPTTNRPPATPESAPANRERTQPQPERQPSQPAERPAQLEHERPAPQVHQQAQPRPAPESHAQPAPHPAPHAAPQQHTEPQHQEHQDQH